jgi:aromatic ring hydroxylase
MLKIMVVKNRKQYIESLKKQNPKVYVAGELVKDVTRNPLLENSVETIAEGYDFQNDPELKQRFTVDSPLISEKISRATHISQSMEDLVAKAELTRRLTITYSCTRRLCMSNLLAALWMATYEADKEGNTSYHENLVEYVKYLQRNDCAISIGMMDPKGDRSLRPHEQEDPDLYLRVVEKNEEGIVVRGAKMHNTAAYSNELIVTPSRGMSEKDKDYAVSFAVPVDAEGLTHIVKPLASEEEMNREMENPLIRHFGGAMGITIFEDVHIPWDRVFLCGEWKHAMLIPLTWSATHRQVKCACRAGQIEMLIGAAALAAEYTGTEGFQHVQDKITNMIIAAESSYGCSLGSALKGIKHESGTFIPDSIIANSGLYNSRVALGDHLTTLHDLAGGLAVSAPCEKDYLNPETRPYLEKYLKGRKDIPTEHKLRAYMLLEDILGSKVGGYFAGSAISAGGTPQTNKIEVYRRYDLEKAKRNAKKLAGIGEKN